MLLLNIAFFNILDGIILAKVGSEIGSSVNKPMLFVDDGFRAVGLFHTVVEVFIIIGVIRL